jgi:uncharacterized SAM-binding protein YcdF (DUF218 family)
MHLGRTLLRWLAGAVLVSLLVTAGIVVRIVQFAHADQHAAADAIVVMGAAQYNGRPSEVFAARLDHAKALYDEGAAGHIVTVGGGQPGDAVTEGEAGRQYLADAGVPESALIAVGTGVDTLISLRAVAAEIGDRGWHSVIIVTDPWHEARCRAIARDLGLATQVSPVTSGPATDPSVELRYIQREVLGTLFYRLVGGSSGAGSAVI